MKLLCKDPDKGSHNRPLVALISAMSSWTQWRMRDTKLKSNTLLHGIQHESHGDTVWKLELIFFSTRAIVPSNMGMIRGLAATNYNISQKQLMCSWTQAVGAII